MFKSGKLVKKENLLVVGALVLVYLGITLLRNFGVLRSYHLQILTLIAINITLVTSLNLVNGFTGQFSLGHGGFFAVGAYVSASLTVFYQIPFALAVLAAGAASSLVAMAIGIPALRLRGDYLAIATLGFGEIIRVILLNIQSVGGARGFSGVPRYTTFGLAYLVAVLTVWIIKNFIQSDHGRACLALRDDEIASGSLGINTTYFKSLAFALGAFFPGIAGALFIHYMQYIAPTPTQIGFLRSIDILIMAVLGGLGSLTGSVLAAFVLTLIPEALRDFAEYRMLIYPVLLLLTMLFRPKGLMAGKEISFLWIKEQVSKVSSKFKPKGMKTHESRN